MPSINVYDNDYTRPDNTYDETVTIVIPGFVKDPEKFAEVADENNVAELKSLDDFNNYVGAVAIEGSGITGINSLPTYANAEVQDETAANFLDKYQRTLSPEEFYSDTYKNRVYIATKACNSEEGEGGAIPKTGTEPTLTEIEANAETHGSQKTWYGKKIIKYNNGTAAAPEYEYYILYPVTADGLNPINGDNITAINSGTLVGVERDATFKYTEAVESTSVQYIICDEIGSDGVFDVETESYGNKIAKQALSLGFTVLYKQLDSTNAGSQINNFDFYSTLQDKSMYDFRFILNGIIENNKDANNCISQVAALRKDCTALLDIDEQCYAVTTPNVATSKATLENALEAIKNKVSEHINANEYSAFFTPAVYYGNEKYPASYHYLTCFALALNSGYAEWFAPAGKIRGIGSPITKTTYTLGQVAINALEPRTIENKLGLGKAVNIITKLKNTYYLWGNRTAKTLSIELTAGHFLNIRQLITSLSKELYAKCSNFMFDPNSETLWANFTTAIKPTLDKMVANEGIKDYRFVRVPTSKKAEFKAKIRIVPIEAVEDFDIEIALEDSLEIEG